MMSGWLRTWQLSSVVVPSNRSVAAAAAAAVTAAGNGMFVIDR